MKTLQCTLCGLEFSYDNTKPGRPKEFCRMECRKLFNMLPWMEDLIQDIDKNGMTGEKKASLRSRLFSMSNLLNYKK